MVDPFIRDLKVGGAPPLRVSPPSLCAIVWVLVLSWAFCFLIPRVTRLLCIVEYVSLDGNKGYVIIIYYCNNLLFYI
jgi:hypothetical protein